MLPWSKVVCCIVVSIGQGDEGIACMEQALLPLCHGDQAQPAVRTS